MKKLNKLSINPEKVIKNDELSNLRGGYDPCPSCGDNYYYICYCPNFSMTGNPLTNIVCEPITDNSNCQPEWECTQTQC